MIDWRDVHMEFDAAGNAVGGEVVFSHVDDKTGEVRHFAVERLEKMLRTANNVPIITIPIDTVFAHFAVVHRGVEPHRFARITERQMRTNPIMLAHMPGVGRDLKDSEHLIIDGIHRYCKAAMKGWRTIRAYNLEPEIWEQYLIRLPEQLDDFYRHQLSNQHINPIDSRIR